MNETVNGQKVKKEILKCAAIDTLYRLPFTSLGLINAMATRLWMPFMF